MIEPHFIAPASCSGFLSCACGNCIRIGENIWGWESLQAKVYRREQLKGCPKQSCAPKKSLQQMQERGKFFQLRQSYDFFFFPWCIQKQESWCLSLEVVVAFPLFVHAHKHVPVFWSPATVPSCPPFVPNTRLLGKADLSTRSLLDICTRSENIDQVIIKLSIPAWYGLIIAH